MVSSMALAAVTGVLLNAVLPGKSERHSSDEMMSTHS